MSKDNELIYKQLICHCHTSVSGEEKQWWPCYHWQVLVICDLSMVMCRSPDCMLIGITTNRLTISTLSRRVQEEHSPGNGEGVKCQAGRVSGRQEGVNGMIHSVNTTRWAHNGIILMAQCWHSVVEDVKKMKGQLHSDAVQLRAGSRGLFCISHRLQ